MNGEVPTWENFFDSVLGKDLEKGHACSRKIKSKTCMRSLFFANQRAIWINLTCSGYHRLLFWNFYVNFIPCSTICAENGDPEGSRVPDWSDMEVALPPPPGPEC